MIALIEEARSWREAITAAKCDGFVAEELDDAAFLLRLGRWSRPVLYGEGIMQRAVDAALGLLLEEERAGH